MHQNQAFCWVRPLNQSPHAHNDRLLSHRLIGPRISTKRNKISLIEMEKGEHAGTQGSANLGSRRLRGHGRCQCAPGSVLVAALVRTEFENLHRRPSGQDPAEVPKEATPGGVHGAQPEPEEALGHAPQA